MKKILLAASCFLVCACNNNIGGTLTVNTGQTLQLKDTKGNVVSFPSGSASVSMSNGKIVIKGTTTAGKTDKVELDGTNLPGYDQVGEHTWAASTSTQPVNIDELNQDTSSTSGEYNGWESCSVSIDVEVPCPPPAPPRDHPPGGNPPGNPPGPPPGGGGPFHPKPGTPPPSHAANFSTKTGRAIADEGCWATRVIPGHQPITFHFGSNSFEIQLIFTDPTSGTQLATFQGFSDTSGRVIDSVGPCLH